jgi:hypothetical protein
MSNNLENTYCQIRSARAFFVVPAVSRAGSLTEQVRAPFKVQGQNWGRLGNSRTVDEPALKHPAPLRAFQSGVVRFDHSKDRAISNIWGTGFLVASLFNIPPF